MNKLLVVCTGNKETRFDRDYYATKHLALALECWGKYGLDAAEAFYPAGEGDGWVSIGVYRFKNRGDVEVALAAPETERIMADVKHFTDAAVIMRSLFEPM
ncbi:EthD family reductase [Hymenobacter setariae]|uniref:EthD family reductase n=1 Tax=Hymenobacter setariae TaxID=2594794 RepID=A0A558BS43_9BACT|nr:EthD family reductase [Hymenobacter setariae]TVT39336.1 EthD family reductase [Hymenobacter setariae]